MSMQEFLRAQFQGANSFLLYINDFAMYADKITFFISFERPKGSIQLRQQLLDAFNKDLEAV